MLKKGFGTDPPTIGIDFDGTIVKPNAGIPVEKTELYPNVRETLKKFHREGWKIVIDTCRNNVEDIRNFLDKHKIPYDWINKNPLQPKDISPTKLYTNLKLDDRAVTFRGWDSAFDDSMKRHKELKAQKKKTL